MIAFQVVQKIDFKILLEISSNLNGIEIPIGSISKPVEFFTTYRTIIFP